MHPPALRVLTDVEHVGFVLSEDLHGAPHELRAEDREFGVVDGDDGLLASLDNSTTCLDCSTIDAATARRVGEAAAAAGIGFMDSPVSGGVAAAAAGTLAFMCGGSAETFEKARRILADMGKNIFHAGPTGAGQVAKGCNNMLLAILMAGTAEALALGEGGEARAPMAVATAGGMTTSTIMTLFVVPVVYAYMDRIGGRLRGKREKHGRTEEVAQA